MSLPKTAFVTGAAKRIGNAIARDLAADGYAVAIHYNGSAEDAGRTVDDIRRAGGTAIALQADLTDEAAVAGLIPKAVEALGPIGVLVNNASAFEADEWDTVTRESWDLHLETNLRAPFVLMQAMAQALGKSDRGAVINMIDQRVWNLNPHFVSYTVAKAGLWTLTQTMAQALAPRVRVNGIGPGPTLSNARQTDADFEAQWKQVPLKRKTDVGEICAAVRFLIAASAMTGQMLALDGGEHLGWAQPTNGFTPTE